MAHRIPPAHGHRHLLHLCGRSLRDLFVQGVRRGRRSRHGRRSAGTRARPDRQVLASFCAANRFRNRRHINRLLPAYRRRHELRRRQRRQGFRILAESDARSDLPGRLPRIPAAHEGNRQAAVRAFRPGGRLCGRHLHGQGRFLRIPASGHFFPAAIHAVQAGIRPGFHHLPGIAVRGVVGRGTGRYRRADQGRLEPSAH